MFTSTQPKTAANTRISGSWPILALGFAAVMALASCTGGGAEVQPLPDTNSGSGSVPNYSGPPPATEDVQRFKINVWDNLVPENRCGSCHIEGGQSPMFVRKDDINLAYAEANTVVNLNSPSESRMVQKVAGGHNCWLSSDQACADIILGYISDWAGGALGGQGKTIQLVAPPIKDPGASKNFPATSSDFASTMYPLLTQNCSRCHSEDSATPQSPYFASADVDTAYLAAQSKINLDNPTDSRFVVRLGTEFHNCWSDCAANAQTMEAAIVQFASGIPLTQIDPNLVTSKALLLTDGILANTGGRHESNVIAKWEFKTGQGTTAFDTSGVNPAIDLTLSGDVTWVGGWGIQIKDGRAQGTTAASKKLYDLITATGEYSIEAWVAPANVTQEGPARIVSYSGSTTARNFTLGQTLYNYDFLNRSSNTDANGEPAMSTPDADEVLQAALQHVVVNYDPVNGRSIYVNGQLINTVDPAPGGNLSDWDDTFAFVLGNEVSGDRLWQGTIRLVAIHNHPLTPQQINDNYKVGVGEKFLLLFNVSDHVNVPDAYVVFEVSQYDSYSYLFNKPFFIILNGAAPPEGTPIKGMRIGINGREAPVGQAYANLDVTLSSASYNPATGQPLSDLGTIIALEKGPAGDEFFLTFDQLGASTYTRTEPPLPPAPPPTDLGPFPDVGIKTFEEINATMAAITGVSPNNPNVMATFDTVKQALPTIEDINTFVSAQQMAITQLSIEYCNALVEDVPAREALFGTAFDFNETDMGVAFTPARRDMILDPLLARILNAVPGPTPVNLATQPDFNATKAELSSLIDKLTVCGASCPADRTKTVVKAACAAALGNAAMLLQ
jgi:hypothetical protein